MNTWMIIFVLILMIMLGLCAFAPFILSGQLSEKENTWKEENEDLPEGKSFLE